jgi:hypothetical protein
VFPQRLSSVTDRRAKIGVQCVAQSISAVLSPACHFQGKHRILKGTTTGPLA